MGTVYDMNNMLWGRNLNSLTLLSAIIIAALLLTVGLLWRD